MGGKLSRRRCLAGMTLSIAGLAGCIADDGAESPSTEPAEPPGPTDAPTEESTDPPSPTETREPAEPGDSTSTETPSETEPTETGTTTETPESTSTTETPPSQPKIREVTDNFGHTFTFTDDDYSGEPVSSVTVEDEIIVEDGLDVRLCVTDVDARSDDDLTFTYRFGHSRSEHPDNPRATDRIEKACWTWGMQREDYQSDWVFMIWVRNGDDVYYQNQSVESDYRVDIRYTNLTVE